MSQPIPAGTLSGRTALVTGSSRGIGADTARYLAEAGANVVINYRNKAPRAQKLAKEYGVERLVSACGYANSVGTQTIESVSNILRHDIDLRSKSRADRVVSKPVQHENVRGAASYDGSKS